MSVSAVNPLTALRQKFGKVLAATWYQIGCFDLKNQIESANREKPQHDNQHLKLRSKLIRRILRRYPYWSGGHLVLGSVQLAERNQVAAFASALAAQKLRGDHDVSARYLLAKVYLQSGKGEEASSLLRSLNDELPERYDIAEDLAAALLYTTNEVEALKVLEAIPEGGRTGQSETVLRHLRTKIQ